MEMLRKLVPCHPPTEDMKTIYTLYIRIILKHSCTTWHSSRTQEDRLALEIVQKNDFRNIILESYESYDNALKLLNMETLHERRYFLFC